MHLSMQSRPSCLPQCRDCHCWNASSKSEGARHTFLLGREAALVIAPASRTWGRSDGRSCFHSGDSKRKEPTPLLPYAHLECADVVLASGVPGRCVTRSWWLEQILETARPFSTLAQTAKEGAVGGCVSQGKGEYRSCHPVKMLGAGVEVAPSAHALEKGLSRACLTPHLEDVTIMIAASFREEI